MNIKYYLIICYSLIAFSSNGQESLLIDRNGCKVIDPHLGIRGSVEWTGKCIDKMATGYGQLIWYKNGQKTNSIYTGTMLNGRAEGEGKYIIDSNIAIVIYEGKFQNGELYFGRKTFKTKKDSSFYYGELKNWNENGNGIIHYSFDTWFEGEFESGYFKKGTYTLKKEGYSIESEEWKDNFPKNGRVIWKDGTVYDGELKKYQPHGSGVMICPEGKTITGKWKKGILVKNGM